MFFVFYSELSLIKMSALSSCSSVSSSDFSVTSEIPIGKLSPLNYEGAPYAGAPFKIPFVSPKLKRQKKVCVTPLKVVAAKTIPSAPKKSRKKKEVVKCEEIKVAEVDDVLTLAFQEYQTELAEEASIQEKILPIIRKRRLAALKSVKGDLFKELIQGVENALEESSMDLFRQIAKGFEKLNSAKESKCKRAKK
jgi:hypothetical protein